MHHEDTGVASALINTGQQVGGSISTALLTTVASSAATDYLSSHRPGALTVAQAAVESYTATLAWGAGFFVVGAVLIRAPDTECGACVVGGRARDRPLSLNPRRVGRRVGTPSASVVNRSVFNWVDSS